MDEGWVARRLRTGVTEGESVSGRAGARAARVGRTRARVSPGGGAAASTTAQPLLPSDWAESLPFWRILPRRLRRAAPTQCPRR